MSLKLFCLLVLLVAAGWVALGGLIASLWQDGLHLTAHRRRAIGNTRRRL